MRQMTFLLFSNAQSEQTPHTFRKLPALCITLMLLCALASCKKDPPDPNTGGGERKGAVCAIGEPQGDEVSKVIGSQGGTITSADNRIQVDIPAGALSNETTINILPIRNTNLAGTGMAYRITPHGQQFAKPVTITFSYAGDQSAMNLQQVLGIAYQDDKGVWQSIGGVKIDSGAKKISVQTKHFSDWSLFQSIRLEPISATIGPGETVTLRPLLYDTDDGSPVPAYASAGKESALGEPSPVLIKYLDYWNLDGLGSLDVAQKEAVYKAPSSFSGAFTRAVVSAKLSMKDVTVLLITEINVANEGIFFRINNGDWIQFDKDHSGYMSQPYYVYGNNPKDNVIINWSDNKPGIYHWNTTMEGWTVGFDYGTSSVPNEYLNIYTDNAQTQEFASPGSLNISHMPNTNEKYVSGEFIMDKAGRYNKDGEPVGTAKIEGFFYIKTK